MDPAAPSPLLGGLSPQRFMRVHWQKQPLLVRGAWPGVQPPLSRAALFALAAGDAAESRLVQRSEGAGAGRDDADAEAEADAVPIAAGSGRWRVRHGPVPRRALPPLAAPGWTLLVQGLDLHDDGARALLDAFRFVPDARLDDLMVSWASPGGGVGPHVDSYDVFLLQLQGRRRWRVAPPGDGALVPGQPLKILARFEPASEWVLDPGDLLYVPPGWGHDGTAEGGACMTASIGFRAPGRETLARELLQRLADDLGDDLEAAASDGAAAPRLYADARQPATDTPAAVPARLRDFAADALRRALAEPDALDRALGALLSEPKPQVWFDARPDRPDRGRGQGVRLDRRTRMLHDARHVFVNGEALRAGGRDAALMRRLADRRALSGRDCDALGTQARGLLDEWLRAGWLHLDGPGPA